MKLILLILVLFYSPLVSNPNHNSFDQHTHGIGSPVGISITPIGIGNPPTNPFQNFIGNSSNGVGNPSSTQTSPTNGNQSK
jgi:hypothetical protein